MVAVIGGGLWHRRRSTSGSWSDWTKINTPAAAGKFTAVSCAGFASWLTVVGLGAKGASSNLWHTIRKPDGSQQTAVANIPDAGHDRSFTAVSCATVGNDVHVLGVHGGDIWHTVRYRQQEMEVDLGIAARSGRPGRLSSPWPGRVCDERPAAAR